MINKGLIKPSSIAVIGASDKTNKPGGKVIQNLIEGGYKGALYGLNPRDIHLEGVELKKQIDELPEVDLAILAIPAEASVKAVKKLAEAGTRAFIIFSAGFGEAGEKGEALEQQLLEIVNEHNASLIGPNCIGILNEHYKGVFTSPVPEYHPDGVELVSSSGATAVFIMEAAWFSGLRFSNVYSIGNASQIGVEEILEDMDQNYVHGQSPAVKLLYLEDIRNPFKFLQHASSLVRKGAKIAAIKSGFSEAGGRAASSHTGAVTTPDTVIRSLFRKAGIVYCSGREELISAACVWQNKELHGPNLAVITHAGGSAVMLTDTLSSEGMNVPPIPESQSKELLKSLHPGSSVTNPIDFLATGTADQLGKIIDFCEELDDIDGMVVVFGSPGLFKVGDVYDVLDQKMKTCSKPIYPVLPSLINAGREIEEFLQRGNVNFSFEVTLGKALAHTYHSPKPTFGQTTLAEMDVGRIRDIMRRASDGFLGPVVVRDLLEAAGIHTVPEMECKSKGDIVKVAEEIGFPMAAKVVGPVHKTEVDGVKLNIQSRDQLFKEFERMMKIKGARACLVQRMEKGMELFCGAVKKDPFGHLVACGLGGIFVEIIRDLSYNLAPISKEESTKMVQSLKAYPLIKGYRNKPGVNEALFAESIFRISSLVYVAPEIAELDINPFIAGKNSVVAVDARIRVEK